MSQIFRNAAFLFLAYVLPRVFTVVSVAVAARWLGADGFGMYGAAAALAVIVGVLASLGMLPMLVREIAQAPARAPGLLASAHRVKILTCCAMLVATWVASGLLFGGQPEVRAATIVLGLGWAVQSFAENFAAYFQAVERMGRWTQASALFGLVSMAVGIGLLAATGSIVAYSVGFVAGWSVALAWLAVGLPADIRNGTPDRTEIVRMLRGMAPFAAACIGLAVYSKLDVLLLRAWSSPVEVGFYAAAYKSIDIFQALVMVAAGAVYPRLSRAARSRRGDDRASRAAEVLLLGAVPVGACLHLAAAPVAQLLYGSEYAGSVAALSGLALLMPMLSLTVLGNYVLAAVGRMTHVAALYALGAAANVALNCVLIPVAGAAGAAFARLGSEALLLAGFLVVMRTHAGATPRRRVVGVALAAFALGMSFALVPDSTDGLLRASGYLLVLLLLYTAAGVVRLADLLTVAKAVARPPAPAPS